MCRPDHEAWNCSRTGLREPAAAREGRRHRSRRPFLLGAQQRISVVARTQRISSSRTACVVVRCRPSAPASVDARQVHHHRRPLVSLRQVVRVAAGLLLPVMAEAAAQPEAANRQACRCEIRRASACEPVAAPVQQCAAATPTRERAELQPVWPRQRASALKASPSRGPFAPGRPSARRCWL